MGWKAAQKLIHHWKILRGDNVMITRGKDKGEIGLVKRVIRSQNRVLVEDNNGAIAEAKEPRSHQKSKHVLRRYHLIREIIERGDVKVCKIDMDSNTADPLTKPMNQANHMMHTASMGLRFMGDSN